MAVAYWRLRRAYRYEVGLIRQELDTTTDDYYGRTNYHGSKVNKTDEEIDHDIGQQKVAVESWEKDKKDFTKMYKAGKPLEEIYDWGENWEWLNEKFEYLVAGDEDYGGFDPESFRKSLSNYAGWSDDQIWQAHIDLCDEKINEHMKEIEGLEKEKKNQLRLQVIKKLGNIPSKDELDRLLWYEGAIEPQLYKALNQLERMQRLRAGDSVPPPLEVDLDVNTAQNA